MKQKHPLYILRKSEIRRQGNAIAIVDDGGERKLFPLSMIGQIWLFGRVAMSDGVRNFLLENGVEILYLSSGGRLLGILDNSRLRSNHRLRLAQYRAFEFHRMAMARHFVRSKLETIRDVAREYPHEAFIERVGSAETLEELLGIEGSATVYLFDTIRKDLASAGISFGQRSYRPPADPVNGLLSLIYTLHYGYFYTLLVARGFDPYIGYLHHKRGRHAPLASDLMETRRVDLSLFVVECSLEERVTIEDFDERHRLKSAMLRPVVSEYARRFVHSDEARSLHRHIMDTFEKELLCR